jgi:hypothetical protein
VEDKIISTMSDNTEFTSEKARGNDNVIYVKKAFQMSDHA